MLLCIMNQKNHLLQYFKWLSFALCPFFLCSALIFSQGPSLYLHSLSVSSNWGDNVASALLPLNRLAFVEGGQSAEPLPAAEPGLSAWPPARGGFKRVGARGASHSHGRTTQEHPSKVSPCPLPRAQPGWAAAAGQGTAAEPRIPITTHLTQHSQTREATQAQTGEIKCGFQWWKKPRGRRK